MYLDGILFFSRASYENSIRVCQVVQRLLENSLFVKAEKCKFQVNSVSFWDYIIESRQVKTNSDLGSSPNQQTLNSYNVSWALLISIAVSSGITVRWQYSACLDRICSQLPVQHSYRYVPFWVFSGLCASPVSYPRGGHCCSLCPNSHPSLLQDLEGYPLHHALFTWTQQLPCWQPSDPRTKLPT